MYEKDERTVLTLDAGGTNLVFSAMQGCEFIVDPVVLPSRTDNLAACLASIVRGFETVGKSLSGSPAAISFAFPGPADYEAGIIKGELPNFPAFRFGVELGPILQKHFSLPVFINNDGLLFGMGEAAAGALPYVNALLKEAGTGKTFRSIIGITLGTGFGCGIVIDGKILSGNNGYGSYLWNQRCYPEDKYIMEEEVSIRAIVRNYRELSGDQDCKTPKDIYLIAREEADGDFLAARETFARFGRHVGEAFCLLNGVVDGVFAIGGGLAGAADFFMPSLLEVMESSLQMKDGSTIRRCQADAVFLDGRDDAAKLNAAMRSGGCTPVLLSSLGASKAISVGAYVSALYKMDMNQL